MNRELAAIATRMGIPVKLDPHDGQPQAFAVATELDWRRAARMSHEPMDLNGWREALGADADTAAAATHGLFAVSLYYSRLLELEKCNAARGAVTEYADEDGDKD